MMTEEKGKVLYSADFSPVSTVCPKCQDVGFIEHNAALLVVVCDCTPGRAVRAKQRAIYGIPEDINDNTDAGARPDDKPIRGPDTGKPKQSSKRKARRKAAKKSS